jgi:AraC family transcriptional regulator
MLKLEKATFLGASAYSFNAEGIAVTETVYHEKVFEGWHCHEHHHITFIMSGGNLEQRRRYETQAFPGTVLSYNSGELHRNTHTRHPSRNINVEIEDSFLAEHQLPFQVKLDDPGLKPALIRIWQESRINDAYALPSIQALVLQLLSAPPSGSTPPWVQQLRSLLNDCWSETFSLQQLSDTLHVHPVTISKHFPRYFSCTLGEYMRKVKIDKALSLIRQPDRSLTDIAYECGFSDQSHFTRTFKAFTGMLPGQYRKC